MADLDTTLTILGDGIQALDITHGDGIMASVGIMLIGQDTITVLTMDFMVVIALIMALVVQTTSITDHEVEESPLHTEVVAELRATLKLEVIAAKSIIRMQQMQQNLFDLPLGPMQTMHVENCDLSHLTQDPLLVQTANNT